MPLTDRTLPPMEKPLSYGAFPKLSLKQDREKYAKAEETLSMVNPTAEAKRQVFERRLQENTRPTPYPMNC